MQVKTTVKHYLIPTRMAIIRNTIISVSEALEKLEPSYIADRNVK